LKSSRIAGLHRMSIAGRIDALAERGWLDAVAASRLRGAAEPLEPGIADRMIENVIGVFGLPLAVAPNFTINGRDFIVPMVVEEPSVVAGVSNAARLARAGGGFTASSTDPVLIGQIQLVDLPDPDAAMQALNAAGEELVLRANELEPALVERGGGAIGVETYKYALPGAGVTVVLHLLVDTRDAMGANLVNSMCERVASDVERLTSGRIALRILSNLADRSIVTASVAIPLTGLGEGSYTGEFVRDAIVQATDFANADRYRAVTHNKGIMNGIDAVAIATGNDWRSLEAAAHAWAARDGSYRSLTQWSVDTDGRLAGKLSMPIKVGCVGGSLRANPAVATSFALLGVQSAVQLAEVMGAVGLAQNLAALRALVTHGIQKGHMSLHARSVAASIGTPPQHFDRVVEGLLGSGEVKARKARQLLEGLQGGAADAAAMPVHGSAFGKVILLGEHAAVYGRHVLALPIEGAVCVSLRETQTGTRVVLCEADGPAEGQVAGPVEELLSYIMGRLGIAERGFEICLRMRIPPAMGLGSSAAVAVGIVRAFSNVLSLNLHDAAVNELAFDCEKLAHGNPSGIDNLLATYGRPVLFRKDASPPVTNVDLEERPPLVIAASGIRGITRDQVAAVRARFEKQTGRYDAIFDEIDELSTAGADALRRRDYDTLGALMNICHGLLNALQVSVPELERMVSIARAAGAVGAKLTGAGGGGSIVALSPDRVDAVERALQTAGYRIVKMTGT
jgi:hydroxymethylglutaryl-CoA reductase